MTDDQKAAIAARLVIIQSRLMEANASLTGDNLEALEEDLNDMGRDVEEARDAVYSILHPDD